VPELAAMPVSSATLPRSMEHGDLSRLIAYIDHASGRSDAPVDATVVV
jgi:hypothetical protein